MNSNKAVVYTHILHAKATCTLFTLRYVIQNGQQHTDCVAKGEFKSSEIRVNGRAVPDILRTLHYSKVCVGQSVEAMCYKLEGHEFDYQWGHWDFSLTSSFWPHYSTGVNSAFNTNEYQGCFLGIKRAGAQGLQPCHLHVPIV